MYLGIQIDITIRNRLLARSPQILVQKGCCLCKYKSAILYQQDDNFQTSVVMKDASKLQLSNEYASFLTNCAIIVLK